LAHTTKKATILNTATENTAANAAIFDGEYTSFKIAPVDATGIPAAATITLLINGRPALENTALISITYPNEAFVWVIDLNAAADKIGVRLSAAATADVIFQVTGY